MNRHIMAMTAGLALLVAGIASAAPATSESAAKPETVAKADSAAKSEEKVCARGQGHEFIYPNDELYVSKCEIGNAGFFTATAKSRKNAGFADAGCCAAGKSAKDVKSVSAEACAPGAACCEVGNAAFFHYATCCGGKHSQMHSVKVKREKKTKESAAR